MKKMLSVLLAAVFALSVTLVAAGCSKSAGKSDKTDNKTSASSSAKQNSVPSSSSSTKPTQSPAGAQSSQGAQSSGNMSDAVKSIALSYYGASEANGDSVTLLSIETAPDGRKFYNMYVNTSNGTHQLLVSEDATTAMEPSVYQATYYGGSSGSANSNSGDAGNDANTNQNNGDNSYNNGDGSNGNNGNNGGGNEASGDLPENTPIPYYNHGPDGAEP